MAEICSVYHKESVPVQQQLGQTSRILSMDNQKDEDYNSTCARASA